MTTIDLSGDWEGHYEQNGGRHGISMHVAQRGNSFVGAMRDADTVLASREVLHAQPVEGEGAQPQVVGEAEVLSTLPERSIVEGELVGRVVSFVKSYQGKSTTSVWVADRANMTFEFAGHRVHYHGTLDVGGDELAGHWSLPSQQGGPPLRDRFVLRRVRSTARPPA
jgi:hypothetical protein